MLEPRGGEMGEIVLFHWESLGAKAVEHGLHVYVSLSRLNHGQPGVQAHPEIVQGTAELHHEIADALLPQADPVFHHATTLDAAVDMLDPQPPLVEYLVG